MRVLFLTNLFPQSTERPVSLLAEGLCSHGVEVHVLAHNRGDGFSPVPGHFGLQHRWGGIPKRIKQLGIPKGSLSDTLNLYIPHRYPPSSLAQKWDLLHCHFGVAGLDLLDYPALQGLPLVVSFYGFDAHRVGRSWGSALYGRLFERAARVLSLGPAMDRALCSAGCPPHKLRRFAVPVETTVFSTELQRTAPGQLRILSVARLVEKKGLFLGMEACASLSRALDRPVEYRIIGDGPLRTRLHRAALEYGSGLRVELLGSQPAETIRQEMLSASLLLVPSLGGSGDEEGTPVVVLEAYALGLPVVGTTSGDLPEILTATTGWPSQTDAQGLAQAMGNALNLEEDTRGRINRAKERVRASHLPSEILRSTLELYGELCPPHQEKTAPTGPAVRPSHAKLPWGVSSNDSSFRAQE